MHEHGHSQLIEEDNTQIKDLTSHAADRPLVGPRPQVPNLKENKPNIDFDANFLLAAQQQPVRMTKFDKA